MKMTTRMELRPLSELIPYARNAREHSEEQIRQLRSSLREFGFVAPLLIDARGNILAGHGRLTAAAAEGLAEVPCVLVEHLTDVQRRAYILADNRLAEQASWNEELVSLELQELQDAGFELDLTGFDAAGLRLEDPPEAAEDGYTPELPEEPRSRRGEIYRLGRHRLMCGDAASGSDVAALLEGSPVQLLLTDPPYNVDYTGATSRHMKLENDAMAQDAYEAFLRSALENGAAALEPGASFYLWHGDGEAGRPARNACHAAGLPVRQCLIWVKQSATLGRQDYQWRHEPCLHGQTEQEEALDCGGAWDSHEACLYGWKDGRAHLWCSDRKQSTVLEFDRPMRSAEHPTMKPVRLFGYLIANSTLPGAAVLDLFAGSGTTAIACEQLGRRACLMELDPRFVDVIIDRWENATGEKAVLVRGT